MVRSSASHRETQSRLKDGCGIYICEIVDNAPLPYSMQFSRSLQELPPLHLRSGSDATHLNTYGTQEPYQLSPMGGPRRTWSSDALRSGMRGAVSGLSLVLPPPNIPNMYPVNPSGPDEGENDGEIERQRGGIKRQNSDDETDSTKKTKGARKTAVACNFCRGRWILTPLGLPSSTKILLSPLIQEESCVVTENDRPVSIALSAHCIANMYPFQGVGDLGKPLREADPRRYKHPHQQQSGRRRKDHQAARPQRQRRRAPWMTGWSHRTSGWIIEELPH